MAETPDFEILTLVHWCFHYDHFNICFFPFMHLLKLGPRAIAGDHNDCRGGRGSLSRGQRRTMAAPSVHRTKERDVPSISPWVYIPSCGIAQLGANLTTHARALSSPKGRDSTVTN